MFCNGCWECYPFIEGDSAITRWRQSDRLDRASRHLYRTIALSLSYHHRSSALSCNRPLSCHFHPTIAPSLHRYRIIASSHYRSRPRWWGWCDRSLIGFHTLRVFSLSGKCFITINCLFKCNFFPAINSFPRLYFLKYINF